MPFQTFKYAYVLVFSIFSNRSKGNSYRVPRHDKKENQQLSPVKKRVKESSPPHQQRYNRASHVSPQFHNNHHNCNYGSSSSYGGQSIGGAVVTSASSGSKYCPPHLCYVTIYRLKCQLTYMSMSTCRHCQWQSPPSRIVVQQPTSCHQHKSSLWKQQ